MMLQKTKPEINQMNLCVNSHLGEKVYLFLFYFMILYQSLERKCIWRKVLVHMKNSNFQEMRLETFL